ncbi:MAG: DUF2911 domain-containing protein [Bacteroidia bacterium]
MHLNKTITFSGLFILIILLAMTACTSPEAEQNQEETKEETTAPPTDEKANRASPPKVFEDSIQGVYVRVDYSSPGVKGRKVWGELVKYNDVWRTGANEATTILVDKPVLISGQPLPAGRYAFFTVPQPDQWTIIFNAEPDQWGAFEYNKDQDIVRVNVKPDRSAEVQERMAFLRGKENTVELAWEYLRIPFAIQPQQ